ncbi:MAG: substrate-binding domain-containing protein [Spirochaetes bacterium]|nr:substrate-binding domain-containing protein [Spirochaetota bacterium]
MAGTVRRACAAFSAALVVTILAASLAAEERNVIFATTTSTQDTGLLDALVPIFQKKTGYFLKVIAVGSGQAMALGERGEADVLLVHSPEAEKRFMDRGFGIRRRVVMHNDFVLVGPESDPAGIRGMKSASWAFKAIAAAGVLFVGRGDNSGTDVKEKKLWRIAGVSPEGQKWYQQTGLGMGHTLRVTSEKSAYTLSDRSTYLSMKRVVDLAILVEGDPDLMNVYHVIQVNPAKWPKVNAKGAQAFADFLVSKGAQELIANFGRERFGTPLFFPNAVR